LHQWDIELTAVGFTDSSKSKALMTWQRPLSGSMTNDLRPGMQLAAYFRGRDKEVLASRHFRLGTEKLQDVSLLPIQ
jgi:hypothetical protein